MTPIAGRSVALIAALSSGVAFYRGCYLTATALGATTYAALSSITIASNRRPRAKLPRSLSSPGLLESDKPSVSQMQSIQELNQPVSLKQSLFQPPSVKAWSTAIWEEEHLIRNKSSPPLLSLYNLPRRASSLFERIERMRQNKKHMKVVRNEIIDGIVVMKADTQLDWNGLFPGQPLSLEIGDVVGAARRTRLAGGAWVVVADYWWVAQEINHRCDDDSCLIDPLIIYQNVFRFNLSFLANGRFKRINLRLLSSPLGNLNLIPSRLAQLLDDGGELRLIIKRDEYQCIQDKREVMEEAGFAPPEERFTTEELVEDGLFGRKVTLSEQLHLIYRGLK